MENGRERDPYYQVGANQRRRMGFPFWKQTLHSFSPQSFLWAPNKKHAKSWTGQRQTRTHRVETLNCINQSVFRCCIINSGSSLMYKISQTSLSNRQNGCHIKGQWHLIYPPYSRISRLQIRWKMIIFQFFCHLHDLLIFGGLTLTVSLSLPFLHAHTQLHTHTNKHTLLFSHPCTKTQQTG